MRERPWGRDCETLGRRRSNEFRLGSGCPPGEAAEEKRELLHSEWEWELGMMASRWIAEIRTYGAFGWWCCVQVSVCDDDVWGGAAGVVVVVTGKLHEVEIMTATPLDPSSPSGLPHVGVMSTYMCVGYMLSRLTHSLTRLPRLLRT